MKKNDKFLRYLREYLTVFMPKQRNYSQHTITAVQQVWGMLLSYICVKTGKRLEKLDFTDFNYQTVTRFLDEMESTKTWKPATRNHRLSRIRSFFRYAAELDPALVIHLVELKRIHLKKEPDKSYILEFMSPETVSIILSQPDTSKKMGVRDTFLMTLMFDSAARDCEMLSMRLCDIDVKRKVVYLLGKGNKPRYVPINQTTIEHFQKYAKLYHSCGDKNTPMFYTIHHGEKNQMSDDNVARFFRKYGKQAKAICQDVPENVHPHMLRKSRAMSLYRSGMALSLISEWLGHSDPETTLIYARADTEMKRKAIEKAEAVGGLALPESKERMWDGNDCMIRQLLGLAPK